MIQLVRDRRCKFCQERFNRRVEPSGRVESIVEFQSRKFCRQSCYLSWNCGKNNPNYVDGFRRGHEGGYLRHTDGRYVHRTVMEKKIGRPLESDEFVHHINGDPADNRIRNLQIITNSEHLILHNSGEGNGSAKLNEKKIRKIRKLYSSGTVTQLELGKQFGIEQTTISSIVRRNTWKVVM